MVNQQIEQQKVVTADDVAKVCGVHRSTVRRVMCNDPRISAKTAQRVWEAAREIGYDPTQHIAARRLALQKQQEKIRNFLIGSVFPIRFQNTNYFMRIYRGMLDVLEHEEYALLTSYYHLPETSPLKNSIPPALMRGEVDGLILVRTRTDFGPFLSRLHGGGHFTTRPIVTLLHTLAGNPAVLTDDQYGAYAATRHLLEFGHRHVLQMVVQQDDETMLRRIAGIQQALREGGLDPAAHLHQFEMDMLWNTPYTLDEDLNGKVAKHETTSRLAAYLREHPEVTAILGVNDVSALRIWQALAIQGWRVPYDYSVVGFDNTDAQYEIGAAHVELTTVHLPLDEVGRTAIRLLLDLISENTSPRSILLPTELVPGNTTGPRRSH